MDIISTKEVDIMLSLKRRVLMVSAITFILVACFTAGYFAVTGYFKWKNKGEYTADAEGKQTVNANASLENLVNSETIISLINRYIAEGKTVYTENNEVKADKNIIGMNKTQLTEYYRNKGYTLIEYSSSNVSLLKEIKVWPPNRYVVKDNNNKVAIFRVNNENALVIEEETNITMDLVPEGDKEAINIGKVYETLDEAREYVEYSLGS